MQMASNELYTQLNEAFFKEVREVYIDLRIIQDIYLGVLLKKCVDAQNEEAYNHLRNNIPKYNQRFHDDYAAIFPQLNMTNEDIEKELRNPNNTQWLLECSPLTSVFIEVQEWASEIKAHNNRNKHYKPIIWNVNVYPFVLSKAQIQFLKQRIQLIDPTAILGVVSKPIHELSSHTLRKCNVLLIYDLISVFSSNKKLSKWVYENHLFINSTIYGPSRLEDLSLLESDDNEVLNSFKLAASLIGVFCEFGYLDIHILTE